MAVTRSPIVTLTYTNPRGRVAVFRSQDVDSDHTPYLLQSPIGVGGPIVEHEDSPITGGNGSYFGPPRYLPRTIQTNCMVYGRTAAERDQRIMELNGILDPSLGDGTINYRNHYGEYRINGRCTQLPSFGANTRQLYWKPILVDYKCPYPIWRGMANFQATIAAASATFSLPFRFPIRLGSRQYQTDAVNPSTVDAPVTITITGPATNPVITNATTGAALSVRKSVEEGQTLIITTGPTIGIILIDTDGTQSNALNYVNLLTANWLHLAPGTNRIVYTSDDETISTRVELNWGDWYLGVG